MRNFSRIICVLGLGSFALALSACGADPQDAGDTTASPALEDAAAGTNQDLLPLTLDAGNRSLSKLPLIIAWDQNLFEKHGLDMNLLIPGPDFAGGKEIRAKDPNAEPEVLFRGGTPMFLRAAQMPGEPHLINIGSTDCGAHAHIVGAMGIESEIGSLEDLRGRRIGASSFISTQGFQARLLAQRMGWDHQSDITIVDVENEGFEELENGSADVILLNELDYISAIEMGYPVLFDLTEWDEPMAGNSVAVDPGWLDDSINHEKGRRLMMAMSEAISIFHNQPDATRRILREWNGVEDDNVAQAIMETGAWLPRKPYACAAGFDKTAALYPDIVQGPLTAQDMYDNAIMDEIDASGFLDGLYN